MCGPDSTCGFLPSTDTQRTEGLFERDGEMERVRMRWKRGEREDEMETITDANENNIMGDKQMRQKGCFEEEKRKVNKC